MLLEQGLEGMYYIICVDEANNWWQLRKTDDHQVVACGVGKEFVLKALKRQVNKYKNKVELTRAWNSLEYIKPLKKDVLEARRLQYEVVKDTSDLDVGKVISSSPRPITRRRQSETLVPLVNEEKDTKEEIIKPLIGTIRRRRLVKK